MRGSLFVIPGVVLALVAGIVAGCGGDDDEPTTTSTSAPVAEMPESAAEKEALVRRFCTYLSRSEEEVALCADRVDALAVLNLAAAPEPLEQAVYAVGENNECGPQSGPLCVEETLAETVAAVKDEG